MTADDRSRHAAIPSQYSPPSATAGRASGGVNPRVWLLALGAFAAGTSAQVISGLTTQIAHDFSVGLDVAGGLVGVYTITFAVSAPILAAFTAKVRRDRAAVVALIVFAVANALCAVAPTFPILVVGRVLTGLSGGLFIATAYALAASLSGVERRGAALAAVASGLTGSLVAGVPLGVLLGGQFGWPTAFWFVAFLSVVALVSIAMLVRSPQAAPPVPTLSQRLAPLVHPPTLLALLPTLLCLGLNGGVYTYLGAILTTFGFSSVVTFVAFLVFGLGALVGSHVGGRLVDRYGPIRPMIVVLLASVAIALLVAPSLGAAWTVCIVSFALGAAPWPVMLGQQTRLVELSPGHLEVVLALNNSFAYFGIAAGTALGGVVLQSRLTLELVPTVCAVFPITALLSLLASEALERSRRRREIRVPF